MAIPQHQIDEWFREPSHRNGQDEANRDILSAAKILAETINKHIADGQAKGEALQAVRSSVMACEAYIRWQWPESTLKLVQ